MIRHRLLLLLLAVGLMPGCKHLHALKDKTPQGPRFTDYTTEDFDWESIQRVVIMPVANRSDTPQVAQQMERALAAEMQRNGRFEVLMSQGSSEDRGTAEVFLSGRYDERDMLRLYHRYGAQGILFVKVTQYHPYSSPRLGLSMLLVSPAEGVVIAATDGMWDLRQGDTQQRARNYVKDFLEFDDSLFETDRVMQSPYTFQRFVAYEVSKALEITSQPWRTFPGKEDGVMQAGYQEVAVGPDGWVAGPYGPGISAGGGVKGFFRRVFGGGDAGSEYCEPASRHPMTTWEAAPIDPGAVPDASKPPMNPVTPPSDPVPMEVPVDVVPPDPKDIGEDAEPIELPQAPPEEARRRPWRNWYR